MDSMALSRRLVLDKIIAGEGHARISGILQDVMLSEAVGKRVVEDLQLLGLVRREGEGWGVTDWAEEKLRKIDAGGERE